MVKKSKPSPNDELVGALESIRGLLEKSETKLSAARESLKKAKSPPPPVRQPPTKKYKKPPISNEPVVPVLDDIVLEGSAEINEPAFEDEATMMDIPSLDLKDVVSTPVVTPPPQAPSGHSTEEVLGYIDKIESSLEKRVHDVLLDTLVKVEMEVKHTIEEELEILRKMITEK